MKKLLAVLAVLVAAFALGGCGRPFKIQTAPGFVELENQGEYAYRSTTPEGVVLAVRVVDDESRGDLDFWSKAITLQLRDVSGYAILETRDIASLDGTKGKLLRFGHDEDNKPYEYWVAFFLAQERVFIVEAGANKDQMAKSQAGLLAMVKSLKVKCDGFPAPILASRTCNRW